MRTGCLLLAGSWLAASAVFGGDAVIDVGTDRSNAVYRCGEKALFTVSVCESNLQSLTSGVLRVTLRRDGYQVLGTNIFDLSKTSSPFAVSGTLEKPAFLHLDAYVRDNGKIIGHSGAVVGFDPEKIQPATRFPDDFRAWWDGERKKLASVPLDAKLEPIGNYPTNRAVGYRLSVSSANGERVYGFLAIPAGTGTFPVLAIFPGAGPGFQGPSCAEAWSRKAIVLNMNVHKYPVPTNSVDAEQAKKDYEKNVATNGIHAYGYKDPRTYHFYTIFLGIDRAIDYVLSRPEWNKKILVLNGASQGGWLSLVMAGMKSDVVTAATAGVPFMSDLGRAYHTTSTHLMKMVFSEEADATIPYYAGVNFARFIKCPIIVSVGFRDGSCLPSSVYSAYNVIPSADKTLYAYPQAAHGLVKDYWQKQDEFVKKYLAQ